MKDNSKISEKIDDDIVRLIFDPQRIASELKYLLNRIQLIRYDEEVFRRFLRAVDMFSSAVSQADYVTYVFLLAATVEVLASVIKAFIERSQAKFRVNVKDVKNNIVEQYGLYIEYNGHRYGLIDLRNAIAHGKAEDIDFTLAEKILYKTPTTIEHVLAPKIRKILRDFLENPEEFITKTITI
jgi:hypothetical protein